MAYDTKTWLLNISRLVSINKRLRAVKIKSRDFDINPFVATCKWGLVIYPQTRFSHHCTETAWNFLERFHDFSYKYIGYSLRTEPQKDFSHLCYCSPNFGGRWWETKGTPKLQNPDGEKLVSKRNSG